MKNTGLTQRDLRGGMQDRLKRQQILIHNNKIKEKKEKQKKRLSLIETERQSEGFSAQGVDGLEDFNEPIFKRVRTKRGFFDYE